jgi:hypothetical protein
VSPGIAGYKILPGDPFYRTARQRTARNQSFFLYEIAGDWGYERIGQGLEISPASRAAASCRSSCGGSG